MSNIGYATLQIIPSMRGVTAAMNKELGVIMPGAGSKAGQQWGGSFGSAASSAVNAAARTTATAFAAAVGAGTAALAKGWGRLTTIQDSSAALEISLGSATEAAGVLDDVLGVVRGTPFALDQFAQAGQQMVGMGIEAEKIPRYLTAIGEASATQGKRAGEFAGRLSTTFGQIAAQGQLSLADVWRISDTGVNALGILANHFGLARTEMKDMISSGAVPAGEALDALAAGILDGSDGPAGATIALAGTMEKLRLTMSGAVGGISPALARLGAAFIKPFSPSIVDGANSLVGAIDALAPKVEALASSIAGSRGFEALMGLFERLPALVDGAGDTLGGFAPLLGGIGTAFTVMGGQSLPVLDKLLGSVNPLAAGVVALALASPEARDALGEVARETAPLVGELVQALIPALEDLTDIFAQVAPSAIGLFGGTLTTALTVAKPLVAMITGLTGFLADHASVVALVAGAYAGMIVLEKVNGWARGAAGGFDRLAVKLFDLGAKGGAIDSIWELGGGIKSMAGQMFAVPEWDQTSTAGWAAGAARAKAGFAGVSTALAKVVSAVSIGAVVSLGLAWQDAGRRAREAAEAMRPDGFSQNSLSDLDEYSSILTQAWGKATDAADKLGEGSTWEKVKSAAVGSAQAIGEQFGFAEAKILSAYQSETALGEAATENVRLFNTLRDTYQAVAVEVYGIEIATNKLLPINDLAMVGIERWVEKLKLDPARMSVEEMVGAINDARAAAENGTPATDQLAAAFETLANETSSSTDRMKAWKDALDAALGNPIDIARSTIAIEDSLDKMEEVFREKIAGRFDVGTEAGRAQQGALLDAIEAAQRIAGAYADSGDLDKAALALAIYRQEIIDSGVAAGVTEKQMVDLLDQYGLTPKTIRTQIELKNADEAQRKAEALQAALASLPTEVQVAMKVVIGLEDGAKKIGTDLSLAAAEHYSSLTAGLPRNALGGRVRKGQATWVGERGIPELFTPDTDGRIYPTPRSAPTGDYHSGSDGNGQEIRAGKQSLRRTLDRPITYNGAGLTEREFADRLMEAGR